MNLIKTVLNIIALSEVINLVAGGVCNQPVIRKEIRELSLDERKRFFEAVAKLHETRPINGKNVNRLDYFAWAHDKIYDSIHMNPNFLPWHRYFLQLFQEMIWQVDPAVVVPYWDWTKDSQEPHKSPIFTDEFIGGNGNKQNGYELQNGFMANWVVNYPNTHKIKRCFRQNVNGALIPSDAIDPWPSPVLMDSLLNTNKDYSSFASDAELYHGYVHVTTGGEGAEMGKNYSPHDILFFLHHGYVDRYWWIWQKRNPHLARTYNGNHHNPPRQVNENDSLEVLGAPPIKVKDTFDTIGPRFCYVYSDSDGTKIMLNSMKNSREIISNTNLTKTNIDFNGIDRIFELAKELQTKPSVGAKYSPELKDSLKIGESDIKPLDPMIPLEMMKGGNSKNIIDNILNANSKVEAISSLKGFNNAPVKQ